MKSMTGFGRASATSDSGNEFSAETFSVNKKSLEIRFQLPKEFAFLEVSLRAIVSSRISRGVVNVRITSASSFLLPPRNIKINEEIFALYVNKLKKLSERHEIEYRPDAVEILQLPGTVASSEDIFVPEEDLDTILEAVNLSIDELDRMRTAEGIALKIDIDKRIKAIENLTDSIELSVKNMHVKQKELFLKRIGESAIEIDPSDERLLKEIAFFCDKYDITEEITRIRSHLKQLREKVDQKGVPVGRALEFIMQEIQREINTSGCKNVLPDAAALIIEFKTELEKVREQIQNIE